jgi:hypothetical protein
MNANSDFHWFPEYSPADAQKFGEAETHHVIVLMHGSWVIRFEICEYDFVVPSKVLVG